MKQYDSYKDSGVEWIGKIPSHWEVASISLFTSSRSGGTPDRNKKEYWENGTIPWMSSGEVNKEFVYDTEEYITPLGSSCSSSKVIKKDSVMVALNGQGKTKGMVAVLKIDAACNQSLCAFSCDKRLYYMFLFYNFKAMYKYLRSQTGDDSREGLSASFVKKQKISIPPISEQQSIADYLERTCNAIGKAIATQEKRVELLKELRQNVITQAVTRGINPDAPLKDSGVEWIGEVPEHWKVCRIKNILKQGVDSIKIGPFGSSLTGKVGADLEYKVYGQWNIVGADFNAGTNTVNKETFDKLSKSYKVISGDILVSMMGTIGKCAVIPEKIQEGIMDSHVVKIRLNESIMIGSYFEYIYDKDKSTVIFNQLQKVKGGSIMDGLNSTIIKSLTILVPPLSEQQEIVSYIESQTARLDKSIEKAEHQIELLQELKQSIITEVVTGKRKVV